jgi:RimJ/RimL family protein N-acetyltransferase
VDYPEHIQTERLTLRRWHEEDAGAYAAIWADADVWRSLAGGSSADRAEVARDALARQLRHWAELDFGLWAAIPADADEPVGWIGAWRQQVAPALDGEIEIGWTLRRPWWHRGLATEGATLAVRTAFEHLQPPRVISLIHPQNDRSAAVALRLGMTHVSETPNRDGIPLRVFALEAPPPG